MSPTYSISDTAYLTIILHLSKYPSAVAGLLLGTPSSAGEISIQKALPLAHSALTLSTTPLTEMALFIAEQHAVTSDQKLVGLYFGNEVCDDTSISTVPTRIADRLRSHFPDACLLMVHPPRLAPALRQRQHCFRLCVRSDDAPTWGKGVRPNENLKVSNIALNVAHGVLNGKADVFQVVDFEDHCLDPNHDWFNTDIQSVWSHLQTNR